ncbi:MAG: 4-hydroxy-tetrahydrodipicolinate synthase [Vicinamibacteraceae bacterium]|nr:4-hydroxy-tetrahydrodipicolinate synthase [Vicinamibacteraceae bacterium]
MNHGKVQWKGSYVAVVTPFTASGEIDERRFEANVAWLIDGGADGIVVSGCTGESWALSADERLRLFELAVKVAGPDIPVIAGTGGVRTEDVIALSERAKAAGTAGIMVLPPYYCMAGRQEIIAHYRAISDAVRHPILLYNIPRRTGFNLTPEVLEELVQVEWVVAIKESSADFIQVEATIASVGDQIEVFTGHSAERGVPALLMGAKGFVSSMESQIMGAEAIQMYDMVRAGELDRARQVQLKTLALDERMRRIGTFPANLKAAMALLGRPAGGPRPPLLPLASGDVERVQVVLEGLELMPARV